MIKFLLIALPSEKGIILSQRDFLLGRSIAVFPSGKRNFDRLLCGRF
ncbi:hypothetical protein HMP0721_2123 [Pseudoramibacter alactolyticus ATCC 23263]|uniref:Uncharacterized protein n=1 Tax=Pseudoramibacter alactolyticus ATCC 23263 TaxID=887929 RepID=E6MJD8_9FIRM|nr:hypothetical protein HMP0721_2123 [Pseudoramibacter alactolyticus ATCC 23263]